MRFEFATSNRILFGPGVLPEIGKIAADSGRRALVVIGHGAASPERLLAILAAEGLVCESWTVSGEPTVQAVEEGTRRAIAAECDLVIGFGGGSVLDSAKAIAALAANPGGAMEYLEVIGRGKAISRPPLPMIAVPTTAGAGAEVTRNAVLTSVEQRVKVSLRSPLMLPRVALVDPELTYSLPPAVTASTGMDALAQVIEPFVSRRANPLVDALCRDGIQRVARSLLQAYRQGDDPDARQDMSLASLYGGLALANAGLGAVHGFAAPIGGMFPAPHGAVCARLLAPVMTINGRALRQREPANPALARYFETARLLTGSENAALEDGSIWLEELTRWLHIPGLAAYGIARADFAELVDKAAVASSMQANPIQLNRDELLEILERSL